MRVSHLQQDAKCIRCSECGASFEVRSKTMKNPHELLVWKEGIAAKHDCRKVQRIRKPNARVWRLPKRNSAEMNEYFEREVRRIWGIAAESRSA